MKKEISIIEILFFIKTNIKTISFFIIFGLLISLLINNQKTYESEYDQNISLLLDMDSDDNSKKILPGFFSSKKYVESYIFFLKNSIHSELICNDKALTKKIKINFYHNYKDSISVKIISDSIKYNDYCIEYINKISEEYLDTIRSEYSDNLSFYLQLFPKIIGKIDQKKDNQKLFEILIDKYLLSGYLEHKISKKTDLFKTVRIKTIENNKYTKMIFGVSVGFIFGIICAVAQHNLRKIKKLNTKF